MLDRIQVWGPGRPVNEAGYMSCIRRKPAYGQTVEALIAHSFSMTLSHLLHVINLPLSISQWVSASSSVLQQKLFMGALCEDWHTDWWRNRFRGCLGIQCLHKDTFMNVLWKVWDGINNLDITAVISPTESSNFLCLSPGVTPHTLGSYAGRHNHSSTTFRINFFGLETPHATTIGN